MNGKRVMGRGCVVVGAIVAAFAVVEMIVVGVLHYPLQSPTRIIHLDDRLGALGDLDLRLPHARYWNVEGGNIVYEYNNLGLPGIDVRQGPTSRYVFVVGTSYVEALQVQPENAATSVFQKALDSARQDVQVVNLGYSASDPYTSWYRVKYMERLYHPTSIILVLESFYTQELAMHLQPLRFTMSTSFGTEIPRTGVRALVSRLRMASALLNLLVCGLTPQEGRELGEARAIELGQASVNGDLAEIPETLQACLQEYRNDYGSRFMVISIIGKPEKGELLDKFCRDEGIAYESNDWLLSLGNRFNGMGHFNMRGNYEFGQFLYEAYRKHFPTQ